LAMPICVALSQVPRFKSLKIPHIGSPPCVFFWYSPRLLLRVAAYVSAVPVLPRLAIFALKVMA